MGKFKKHQSDRERFGKCEICLEYIPIEYYFSTNDTIVCYECGTEYILVSKNPIELSMLEGRFDPEDYDDDFYDDDLFFDE